MSTWHDPLAYAILRAKMAGEHFGKRNECMARAAAHDSREGRSEWTRIARLHNRVAVKMMRLAREAAADAVSK